MPPTSAKPPLFAHFYLKVFSNKSFSFSLSLSKNETLLDLRERNANSMGKPSKQQSSSDDALSSGSSSSEDERINEQINAEEDEEELEAVARSADSDDDEAADAAGEDETADLEEVDEVILLRSRPKEVHVFVVILFLTKK